MDNKELIKLDVFRTGIGYSTDGLTLDYINYEIKNKNREDFGTDDEFNKKIEWEDLRNCLFDLIYKEYETNDIGNNPFSKTCSHKYYINKEHRVLLSVGLSEYGNNNLNIQIRVQNNVKDSNILISELMIITKLKETILQLLNEYFDIKEIKGDE